MNKKNKPVFYVLVVFIVALIIFYPKISPLLWGSGDDLPATRPSGPRALNVDAIVIVPGRLVEQINSSGTLIPDEEVDLAFETSGKLVNLNFDEGTPVTRGQLLARINDRPLQAQLLKLKAQKKLAEEREFRQRSLLSRDAISQESYDQIVTELQTIEADIMLIEARISETELRAPFDGVIGLRYVSEGAFVNVNTQIARLIKINPLKIEFAIPERYSGEIKPGFPIRFTLDGFNTPFHAIVYAVDPKVNIRTRSIVVRARYTNPDERVKPGRFVSIELELTEINDAISIPTEALIPEMDGDKVFVYRAGQAESVDVETGLRTEDRIQITSGLQPGDTLVTTGILQLRHGMPLTIDNVL
ncbi:MAG: efflux RND transporter periplasmic adaptor subunit [Bacteroidetes bacterium]|nr:MAG: efflux RND transporter periplasmic adaptor subunit [Bacteroidota bacterium]